MALQQGSAAIAAARGWRGGERSRRLRLLCLNLGHAYTHLFMLLYPTVVISLQAEGAGSYDELLLPSTLGFAAFAAGAVPAGWLGDRWSRRAMLVLMFVGLAGGALITGLADNPWQLAAGLGVIGLFAAIYHPVGIAMLVEETGRSGRALGINGVFGNLGVAAAPLLAALLSESLGWRWAFFLPAIVVSATGLLFWMVSGDSGHSTVAEERGDIPKVQAARWRVFGYIAVSMVLSGLVFDVTTISLPKLVDEQVGSFLTGRVSTGALASLIFAVAAFSQILVGWLIDRYPIRPLAALLPALQAPLLVLAVTLSGWAAYPAALGIMLLVFGKIPISDALVARYSAKAWRARVYAVKYLLSSAVGAFSVPLIALLYRPEAGFRELYLVLAVLALATAAAAFILPSESKR